MRGVRRDRIRFQPPSLLPIPTWCEIKEAGDALQSAIGDDTDVDAPGQWWTTLGTELPGEADAVGNTMFPCLLSPSIPLVVMETSQVSAFGGQTEICCEKRLTSTTAALRPCCKTETGWHDGGP